MKKPSFIAVKIEFFKFLSPPQSPWTTFRSDSNSQSCNIRQKIRKDEYIKECMVWKSGKKGISGKVAFYEIPCILFLMINISGKVWNKSCLKCFKLLLQFFFILMKSEKWRSLFTCIFTGIVYWKLKKKIYRVLPKMWLLPKYLFFRIFKPCIP